MQANGISEDWQGGQCGCGSAKGSFLPVQLFDSIVDKNPETWSNELEVFQIPSWQLEKC